MKPQILHSELVFDTSRSGGAGGQNVNKVETKVELRLDITTKHHPSCYFLQHASKRRLVDRENAWTALHCVSNGEHQLVAFSFSFSHPLANITKQTLVLAIDCHALDLARYEINQ